MRKYIARTEDHAINGINLVLGGILFFSPWLFGFSGEQTAAWTAWITGALIAVVAAIALAELRQWEEWVNGLLGLFVAVSPCDPQHEVRPHSLWQTGEAQDPWRRTGCRRGRG